MPLGLRAGRARMSDDEFRECEGDPCTLQHDHGLHRPDAPWKRGRCRCSCHTPILSGQGGGKAAGSPNADRPSPPAHS
jgi:hypothetical protein